jgi:two-component system chemotaxis response regulator CheB
VRLTTESLVENNAPATRAPMEVEVNIAKGGNPVDVGVQELGRPSSFACPECHGVLLQVDEGGRFRFRCHTGHAYSADSLRAAIDQGIEDALWNSYRSLEEGGLLMRQLATHLEGHGGNSAELAKRAKAIAAQAEELRVLMAGRVPLRMEQ